jgi:hypothetical protein
LQNHAILKVNNPDGQKKHPGCFRKQVNLYLASFSISVSGNYSYNKALFMEKNQQNGSKPTTGENESKMTGERPGQELPTGENNLLTGSSGNEPVQERHSESSLPQSDEETLGTP